MSRVHLSHKPQRVDLIIKEAPMIVPAEYADFANIFSPDLTSKPLIYSVGPVRPSKSPAGALILFDQKWDGSLQLCINYRGLQ